VGIPEWRTGEVEIGAPCHALPPGVGREIFLSVLGLNRPKPNPMMALKYKKATALIPFLLYIKFCFY
jgi:hypothetical protein